MTIEASGRRSAKNVTPDAKESLIKLLCHNLRRSRGLDDRAMAQASFAELEHDLKKRRTRRELFLEKLDKLVPWERLERRIEPFIRRRGAVGARTRSG